MPVACPSPRVTTERRGMAGGCGVRRSPARSPLCASVPCSPHARGAGQEAQRVTVRHADRGCSCGHSTVSPAAGVAWCGAPGVSVASWPRLVGVPLAAAGVSRCGTPPPAALPPASASVPGVRSPEGMAGGSWGAPRVSLPRPQTVPGPASPGGCLPHTQGAGCARSASGWRGPRVAPVRRGRGHRADLSRLRKRVARVRRGRGQACALGCPAGGGAPGPVGTGQVGSRGHSGAEQRRAGDCLQPPLILRFGFRQRLTPSVRCLRHSGS